MTSTLALIILTVGFLYYALTYKQKQILNKFRSTIADTDFNPTHISPNTKRPSLAIDSEKKQFYIIGKTPKIYHASEVTHIQINLTINGEVVLAITVTDSDEPIKYIFLKNSHMANECFGKIQTICNIR